MRGVKEDLTGRRFKTYTALEPVGRASGGSVIWRCVCNCGKEANHQIGNLKNGNIRCKCQNLPRDESAFRELYYSYRRNATKRNTREFDLDRDTIFRQLVTSRCSYCGIEPAQQFKNKTGTFLYNGIDRIDNTVGYVPGNVVPCCGICNKAKHTMSRQQFLTWLARAAKHCFGDSNPS